MIPQHETCGRHSCSISCNNFRTEMMVFFRPGSCFPMKESGLNPAEQGCQVTTEVRWFFPGE